MTLSFSTRHSLLVGLVLSLALQTVGHAGPPPKPRFTYEGQAKDQIAYLGLQEKVQSASFGEAKNLGDLLKKLKRFSTLAFEIDTKAVPRGPETKVIGFSAKNLTVEQVLHLALDPVDLDFMPKENKVVITSAKSMTETYLTRVYPVADLIYDKVETKQKQNAEQLLGLIRGTFHFRRSASGPGKSTVEYLADKKALQLTHHALGQRQMTQLLEGLRKGKSGTFKGDF